MVYFWIPKQQRHKLDPKSKWSIFLKYSKTRKGCKVFNVQTKQIQEVRDCIFFEEKKGSNLQNEIKQNPTSKYTFDLDFINTSNTEIMPNPEEQVGHEVNLKIYHKKNQPDSTVKQHEKIDFSIYTLEDNPIELKTIRNTDI